MFKNESRYMKRFFNPNKTDESNKKVKTDEVSKYCNEHKYSFYEISVKTNKNVNQMMQEIVKVYDKIAYKEN